MLFTPSYPNEKSEIRRRGGVGVEPSLPDLSLVNANSELREGLVLKSIMAVVSDALWGWN